MRKVTHDAADDMQTVGQDREPDMQTHVLPYLRVVGEGSQANPMC